MPLESKFQATLIQDLRDLFPRCIVLKNDAGYLQGFPDLTILWENRGRPCWAVLECKRSADEPHRPNQDYYIDLADNMCFGAFIFPENKEEILNELCETFGVER